MAKLTPASIKKKKMTETLEVKNVEKSKLLFEDDEEDDDMDSDDVEGDDDLDDDDLGSLAEDDDDDDDDDEDILDDEAEDDDDDEDDENVPKLVNKSPKKGGNKTPLVKTLNKSQNQTPTQMKKGKQTPAATPLTGKKGNQTPAATPLTGKKASAKKGNQTPGQKAKPLVLALKKSNEDSSDDLDDEDISLEGEEDESDDEEIKKEDDDDDDDEDEEESMEEDDDEDSESEKVKNGNVGKAGKKRKAEDDLKPLPKKPKVLFECSDEEIMAQYKRLIEHDQKTLFVRYPNSMTIKDIKALSPEIANITQGKKQGIAFLHFNKVELAEKNFKVLNSKTIEGFSVENPLDGSGRMHGFGERFVYALDKKKLFINGLAENTSSDDVKKAFPKCTDVELFSNQTLAHIFFSDASDCKAAFDSSSDIEINDKNVCVLYATIAMPGFRKESNRGDFSPRGGSQSPKGNFGGRGGGFRGGRGGGGDRGGFRGGRGGGGDRGGFRGGRGGGNFRGGRGGGGGGKPWGGDRGRGGRGRGGRGRGGFQGVKFVPQTD